ncbi:uncharacterized protein M6B38_131615 [Iris pallida]|uniref:TmcB/TmcC TPR repeats domain-containing protein n=1 Tax=Iris pallida TaxID=29817 RepID=A0AAX6FQX1_IRIPA|nr:uncharacterized protein M6B38_131615 [Iris pallida]
MRAAMQIRSASFHAIGSAPDNPSPLLQRSRSLGFVPIRCAVHLHGVTTTKKSPAPMTSPPVPPLVLRRARSDSDLAAPERIRWAPPPALEEVEEEEGAEIAGGGIGKGKKTGGCGGGEQNENGRRSVGSYYQEMLKSDPGNPLLLRNYGKFLHEVEGDAKGAEECYGRAILADPGDGDVLSLYGSLVWETHRDEERAATYFERAVEASPDDCYVLGSYASFLWDAEEDEEGEGEGEGMVAAGSGGTAAAVGAGVLIQLTNDR